MRCCLSAALIGLVASFDAPYAFVISLRTRAGSLMIRRAWS